MKDFLVPNSYTAEEQKEFSRRCNSALQCHRYLKELTDWIKLCRKCHKCYDKGHSTKEIFNNGNRILYG